MQNRFEINKKLDNFIIKIEKIKSFREIFDTLIDIYNIIRFTVYSLL